MIKSITTSIFLVSFLLTYGQDTIQIDIPTYNNGLKGYFYNSIRESSEALGLSDLQKGVDSIEIRIWFFYAKRDRSFGKLHIYKFEENWNGKASYGSSNLVEILPKSGWEKFTSKLFKEDILNLQNHYSIKGLKTMIKDGDTYCVEIGDRSSYRFYSYHSPELFKKYKDARHMSKILKLIRREF